MFAPQQPSSNGGPWNTLTELERPHEASSEVGKSTRPPPCKFMTLKQNMDGKMRCFLGSLLGPVGLFPYNLSVSLVIPRLSNQFVFRKSRWPFNIEVDLRSSQSWIHKNPLKNHQNAIRKYKKTHLIWKWLALGDKNPAFRVFYSVAVTDTFWSPADVFVEIFIAALVPKNPDINLGKCLFQNEDYKNYICYQQWIFQTYTGTFASGCWIYLPASSWHVNIEIIQRVKDLDRTHPLFPSPMWDLPFLYVLHDDATTTDQMIRNTQTQLSNKCQTILKIWAALVCWNMLESTLAKEAT